MGALATAFGWAKEGVLDLVKDKVKGLAVAAVAFIGGWVILHWWPGIWSWLTGDHGIPGWLLAGLIATNVAIATGGLIYVLRRVGTDDWRTWFFGMRWRGVDWKWTVHHGNPVSIQAFCPKCRTPMYPTNLSGYNSVHLTVLTCDLCRAHYGPPFDGDGEALQQRMVMELQRRLNSWNAGDYATREAMVEDDREPINDTKSTTVRDVSQRPWVVHGGTRGG